MHLIGNIFSRVKRLTCMPQKDFGPALSEIWSQLSIENDHDGAIMCTSARCFCIELLCACNLGLPDMQLAAYRLGNFVLRSAALAGGLSADAIARGG